MTPLTRQNWLRERSTFVGASEIASILGLPGAYSSIGAVYVSKVESQDGTAAEMDAEDTDPETAEKLDRKSIGLLVEPAILTMYEQRNPEWKVRRNGLQIWRHPKYPFIRAPQKGGRGSVHPNIGSESIKVKSPKIFLGHGLTNGSWGPKLRACHAIAVDRAQRIREPIMLAAGWSSRSSAFLASRSF